MLLGCSSPEATTETTVASPVATPSSSAAVGSDGAASVSTAGLPDALSNGDASTAGGAAPPTGLLLFQSDREGPTRLFTYDLATRRTIRIGSAGPWSDEDPSWSHDGQRVAFASTRGQTGNFDIYVMDADGANPQRLTDHRAPEQDPVWAHDDKSIFFTAERDGRGEIYRVWLDDRRVERITNGINRAIMPATSRDGRYLAYAAQTIMSFQIHLIDLRDGTSRQVTTGGGSCRPGFAPDSNELAFVRLATEPSRLEAVRETGTRVLFAHSTLWSYYPDYSPDGRFVAFSVSPEHHEGEDWDLALIDRERPQDLIRLTSGAGNDRVPVWHPTR